MLTRAARLPARGFNTRALFSTVVEDEVRKFNAASSDWWAPKSTTGVGPLHQINPVRVKYIRSHVIEYFGHMTDDDPMPLRGLRVADVGCGGGILSEALCRIGGTMVSADPGEDNIAAAKKHAAMSRHTSSIDYRQCTSDDLVAQGEQFDVVCSLEVIEHVADVPAFLHSLTPLVKPGGLLFLSSINRTALSAALAIGAAEYVMRIVPPGTHDWNKFVQPGEIETELRKDGFTVQDVSGIVGDPVFRSWRIHPTCTDINYILCATKPQEK
ncbi:hypothetical protein JG687_00003903 [Phytophthora cactorum]|uniref:Ubiquinone biosynthesis O-methyltransferase, mitochondrial n=1 Tax=Phytophthora cactorum TaxID=29920 RepID=A0A329SHR6_9STRA|nr:hypothetical protein Pcac1_g8943 [Phytophthora cactorum]KAG2823485.1 hypothetical protein PC112_g10494 [Phytophthora cactorum]KAG2832934.1 hypothetical protein PC111_g6395 [Phytophthora cactorum]KAG2860698.1 hypothetical protein PC113_g7810 [Phytophthora cactorum]KAG2915539.1 hypothetical protein PC114_g7788 [Phytophthora cactorum]